MQAQQQAGQPVIIDGQPQGRLFPKMKLITDDYVYPEEAPVDEAVLVDSDVDDDDDDLDQAAAGALEAAVQPPAAPAPGNKKKGKAET